jgi:2-keto-3-deoxy-L-fuconate dehydrogenase
MTRFSGKTALVTGAAGGIGAAVVRMLRAEGAQVAVADRDTNGIEAEAHLPGDLLNSAYTDGLPRAAAEALGRLDIVINNAGVITRGKVTETTDADWALSLGVNVEAPFRISRAAIPIMAAQGGGAIVNTASIAGLIGLPTSSAYVAAKHGVVGLTKTAAIEYAESGIRVNAVCPGYIETEMTRDTMARRGQQILSMVPFRRMGKAGEIAEMVCWLCSDRASFVTGASYNVDGGYYAV